MDWRAPDPGELREIIQIEYLAEEKQDGYKAVEPQWRPLPGQGTRRAKVEPLSGREFWFAQQSTPAMTIKVTLRYYDGLTTNKHRFVWRGQTLGIGSVVNSDGMKIWHVCMCQAKAQPAQQRG